MTDPIPAPAPEEHERRVVAVRHGEVQGHPHVIGVKLDDGTILDATDVIGAIQGDEHVHFTMIPPPGAPAREAYEQHRVPLELQVRQCPDCAENVLSA